MGASNIGDFRPDAFTALQLFAAHGDPVKACESVLDKFSRVAADIAAADAEEAATDLMREPSRGQSALAVSTIGNGDRVEAPACSE